MYMAQLDYYKKKGIIKPKKTLCRFSFLDNKRKICLIVALPPTKRIKGSKWQIDD